MIERYFLLLRIKMRSHRNVNQNSSNRSGQEFVTLIQHWVFEGPSCPNISMKWCKSNPKLKAKCKSNCWSKWSNLHPSEPIEKEHSSDDVANHRCPNASIHWVSPTFLHSFLPIIFSDVLVLSHFLLPDLLEDDRVANESCCDINYSA